MTLTVNGVEIPVEKTIDISVVVDPAGECMESVMIKVVGGELTIDNPVGSAVTLHVDADNGAKLRLVGTPAISGDSERPL